MSAYSIISEGRTVYTGSAWRRARVVFETFDDAELVIDGIKIAKRVARERVRLTPEQVA